MDFLTRPSHAVDTTNAPLFMRIPRQNWPILWSHIHVIAVFTALVGTIVYFAPLAGALDASGSHWPGFMMSGDIQKGYFPAFVEGYRRFWAGGLLGIDFFTDAGASVFTFRANLMPLYPPVLIAYLFFDVSNLKTAAAIYSAIHAANLFACLYATVVLGHTFLRMTKMQSVALAIFYGLSFQSAVYITQMTFFIHMMMVPIVAYALCLLMRSRSIYACITLSPVFVTHFLGSYGPLMAGALLVAIFVAVYVYSMEFAHPYGEGPRALLYPALSLGLAGFCVFPYYIAQLKYASEVAPHYLSVDVIAHQLAFTGRDLVGGLSQFITVGITATEGRLNWGLIPVTIIFVGMVVLAIKREDIPRKLSRMLLFSLAAYLPFMLISLGTSLPASDMFYYGMPVLGKMHVYGRFLLFPQIFIAIAVVCAGQIITFHLSSLGRGVLVLFSGMSWLVLSILISFADNPDKLVLSGPFITELFLLFIAIVGLTSFETQRAILPAALLSALIGLTPIYGIQRSAGSPQIWDREIEYNSSRYYEFVNFIDQNGQGKSLVKVLYLTDEIGPYIYRNFPWLVGSRVKMMNFQGYETHLAMIRDYFSLMGGLYGQYNRDWVIESGLDFIIWTDASAGKIPGLMGDTHEVEKTLTVKPGVYVGKIRRRPGTVDPGTLLRLSSDNAGSWPAPLSVTGWSAGPDRLSLTDGPVHNIGYPLQLYPNATYEMTVTLSGATAGLLVPAVGGKGGEPFVSGTANSFKRRFTALPGNDVWLGASSDFNGTVTSLIVEQIRQLPPLPSVVMDDGLLRIEGMRPDDASASVSSDYSSYVTATISARSEVRATYLLWPNQYMAPYLDGRPVEWERDGVSPASVRIPLGDHVLSIRFQSRWGQILRITTLIYAVILAFAASFWIWRSIRRRPQNFANSPI